MTAAEISALARTAQQVGISTLLELRIAGELLQHGEATFLSLANHAEVSLEAIAHACARLNEHCTRTVVCREALGFSMASLTPEARERFRELSPTPA